MKRRVGWPMRCLVGVVAAGLTVALALPWCDVLLGNVVPVLQALSAVWVLLALVCFAAALCTRRRFVVIAFVPALVLALCVAGLMTTSGVSPSSTATHGRHRLTVMSLNAEIGGADADAVMRLVRTRHPDVVVLVEMTRAKLDALDARGLRSLAPHRTSGMIDDGARGSVVLSRWPLTTLDADDRLGHFDLQSPVARIAAPGADVTVRAAHSYPPLSDGVNQWRPQLDRLRRWAGAQQDAHLVIAGDFNASVANPAFRHLRDGFVDAVAAQHTAAWPTWPHGSWAPPFVQIDHVLARGFASQDAGVASIPDTDHAAIWATLSY